MNRRSQSVEKRPGETIVLPGYVGCLGAAVMAGRSHDYMQIGGRFVFDKERVMHDE